MRYKITLACVLLFIAMQTFSQTNGITYYFDDYLNITTQPNSSFTGTGTLDSNGAFELTCYNNATKGLSFIAHFTDGSMKVFNGSFRSFYLNGNPENEENYVWGKENGLWQKWDSLGNKIDSSIYENGTKTSSTAFNYYSNNRLEGKFTSDFKNKQSSSAYYDENGNSIDASKMDEDKVFTKTEISACFPGGEAGWTRYMRREIENHIDELSEAGRSGTCIVRFIVSKDGTVSNAVALTMQGTKLAEIAVKVIMHGPKWMPAQQNGRFVTAFRQQPITFTLTER